MVGLQPKERRPNLHYDLIDLNTGVNYGCPNMGWRYDSNTMVRLAEDGRILWPSSPDGRPRRKSFLNELSSEYTGVSSVIANEIYTRNGTEEINSLFDFRAMDFPKPTMLIDELITQGANQSGLILDFFAGSCTTAHSVLKSNFALGTKHRFIMVQLPELCDENSQAFLSGLKTIADIGKERIRRVIKKLVKEQEEKHQETNGNLSESTEDLTGIDLGFKVFKLDSSNIKPWDADFDNLEDSLFNAVENIKPDRSEADVLYELLLKYGLDLAVPIEEREIHGKTVYT